MFESRNIKNLDCGNSLEWLHSGKHNLFFREKIAEKISKNCQSNSHKNGSLLPRRVKRNGVSVKQSS